MMVDGPAGDLLSGAGAPARATALDARRIGGEVVRARLTVRQLVDDLGWPLARVGRSNGGLDQAVTSVIIQDFEQPVRSEPGCLVLGVGIGPGTVLTPLVEDMRKAGAVALAVKPPLPEQAHDLPLPVLEINADASWMHVAVTIRERLLEQDRAPEPTSGAMGDLFDIANTISEAIGAPVTIEDHASTVLAWSADQQDTDDARVETILGRAVHRRWLEWYEACGVFRRLHRERGPVFIEPGAPGLLPRTAIAVRTGSHVLGYIWAAVSGPLSAEQADRLRMLAPAVALHLVNVRTGEAYARQHRGELAAIMLGGGQEGRGAAHELGIGPSPACVLVAGMAGAASHDGDGASDTTESAARLRRCAHSLALYLATTHPSSATVVLGDAVYALIWWPQEGGGEALESAERLARDFQARSPHGRHCLIAVSGPAAAVEEITTVRAQADAVLTAMRRTGMAGTVGTMESMALPVLLRQLADDAIAQGIGNGIGPLNRLIRHEGPGGELARTLAAYVDSGRAVDDTAVALRVHVNTVRYRLRRIRHLVGLDFSDADAMLLVQLQLRMRALSGNDL